MRPTVDDARPWKAEKTQKTALRGSLSLDKECPHKCSAGGSLSDHQEGAPHRRSSHGCAPWYLCYAPAHVPLSPHLLDHLVRLEQDRRGDGEAEGLGGLEVDHQLELYRLLHGEISRFGPLQDLIDIG